MQLTGQLMQRKLQGEGCEIFGGFVRGLGGRLVTRITCAVRAAPGERLPDPATWLRFKAGQDTRKPRPTCALSMPRIVTVGEERQA